MKNIYNTMKMISDEDLRIGRDKVSDVHAGVMLVLGRCFKSPRLVLYLVVLLGGALFTSLPFV